MPKGHWRPTRSFITLYTNSNTMLTTCYAFHRNDMQSEHIVTDSRCTWHPVKIRTSLEHQSNREFLFGSVKARFKWFGSVILIKLGTHHDLDWWFTHSRNDADDLGRKVTLLACSFTATRTPAATQNGLTAAARIEYH